MEHTFDRSEFWRNYWMVDCFIDEHRFVVQHARRDGQISR